MAATVRELRIKARKLGATNVREMSPDELEEFIAENGNGNGSKGKKVAKKAALKAVKKAGKVKRGPGRPRKVEVEDDEDDEVEEAPRRRGRPKGSTNKKTAVKRGRPAKTEARKTRRSSGGPGRPVGSGTGTRVLLSEKINWDRDFDFREGTTQDYILQQIRKVAAKTKDTSEIREKVFDRLVDKINERDELTFMNRSTGKAHKGAAAEQRLKYYISRTMFDYAVNTGQHEGAGDSVASQPRNGNGNTKKSAKGTAKRGRPRKVVEEDYEDDDDDDYEEEAPRKRGRPKGSTNKKTAKRGPGRPRKTEAVAKRGPGRPRKTEVAPKRRGRPPGSKNKKTRVRA